MIKETCYVCKQTITGEPFYIGESGGPVAGTKLYRHKTCKPGGKRWLEAQRKHNKQQRSELYDYFNLIEEDKAK